MKNIALAFFALLSVSSYAQLPGGSSDFSLSTGYLDLGTQGSPYFSGSFSIINNSSQPLDFMVLENASEVTVSPRFGTLGGFGVQTVTVNVTATSPGAQTRTIWVRRPLGGPSKSLTVAWNRIFPKRAMPVFEDADLREAVLAQADLDGDGIISHEEREAVTELRLAGLGVRDLKGIDIFFNLRYLDVSDNNLTKLPDLTGLANLLILKANHNDFQDPPELAASVRYIEMDDNGL